MNSQLLHYLLFNHARRPFRQAPGLFVEPLPEGMKVTTGYCKCGRALEGFETTMCKFCMNVKPKED